MSFPTFDPAAIRATIEDGIAAYGQTATVALWSGDSSSGGLTFDLKLATGSIDPEDLTAGMTQNGLRLRIPCSTWDALSPGRPPQKGDQVTISGRRYAIQQVHARALADTPLMYVCVASG